MGGMSLVTEKTETDAMLKGEKTAKMEKSVLVAAPKTSEIETMLMARANAVLREHGLSPFGRNMAWQYLRRLADPDPADVYGRVRVWWHKKLVEGTILSTHNCVDSDARDSVENNSGTIIQNISRARPEKRGPQSPLPPPGNFTSWQKGCPELMEGLRSIPIWDTKNLPWVKLVEENFEAIRSELLQIRSAADISRNDEKFRKNKQLFQPYRKPRSTTPTADNQKISSDVGTSATNPHGNWNVLYLALHDAPLSLLDQNRSHFPLTLSVIEQLIAKSSNVMPYNHAFFSSLAAGTHVCRHNGPTNKKLRCHLPLIVPHGLTADGKSKCRLRVGDITVPVKEGRCIVFDDSFEHEAWNDSTDEARMVLVFDVWHPDYSREEVKFLSFLLKSQMRMLARSRRDYNEKENEESLKNRIGTTSPSSHGGIESRQGFHIGEDFLTVITKARDLHVDETALWGKPNLTD